MTLSHDRSDEELVDAFIEGDSKAFSTIVERHRTRLTTVARRNRIIIDAATAEQLPHDQFETRRLPARPVRGFGILEPLAVWRH